MRILLIILLFPLCLIGQSVPEGLLTINYTDASGKEVLTDVYFKGDQFCIRHIKNGNPKYSAILFDAASRKMVTLSVPEKKVGMIYNFDRVAKFYETNQIKAGYKLNSPCEIKFSDKKKTEQDRELKKGTFATAQWKGSAWVAEVPFRISDLFQVLHLIGSWNEVSFAGLGIYEMEAVGKESKKGILGRMNYIKQEVPASMFEVPKIYQQVDFDGIMQKFMNDPQVVVLVQSFTEF
jgi:hypothetical protein